MKHEVITYKRTGWTERWETCDLCDAITVPKNTVGWSRTCFCCKKDVCTKCSTRMENPINFDPIPEYPSPLYICKDCLPLLDQTKLNKATEELTKAQANVEDVWTDFINRCLGLADLQKPSN